MKRELATSREELRITQNRLLGGDQFDYNNSFAVASDPTLKKENEYLKDEVAILNKELGQTKE